MDFKTMTLEQVKGNTWVLKSWLMIPLYKVDAQHCILLDSGLRGQRAELEQLLEKHGLTCVGILGSHAHMDHTGSHAYFQAKYHATVALSLGEAGIQASALGIQSESSELSPESAAQDERLMELDCVADVIVMPQDTKVTLCGVTFDVFHTPGHSVDHLCIRTPDGVLYVGDAMMSGRELFQAKFPYALALGETFESLCKIREIPAAFYIAAHGGVYPEIRSFVDMEIRFLTNRMREILSLLDGKMTGQELTRKMCHTFGIVPRRVTDLSYFEHATRAYIAYLLDRKQLEAIIEDGILVFQRVAEEEKRLPLLNFQFWMPASESESTKKTTDFP